jgi:hypothetical protein
MLYQKALNFTYGLVTGLALMLCVAMVATAAEPPAPLKPEVKVSLLESMLRMKALENDFMRAQDQMTKISEAHKAEAAKFAEAVAKAKEGITGHDLDASLNWVEVKPPAPAKPEPKK